MIYALDSNIISYILKNDKQVTEQYLKTSVSGNKFVMPPLVYFEVKRWLLEINSKNKQNQFKKMCADIPHGKLDKNIWDKAAELYVKSRKSGKSANDADLIIAAFCIVNNYTLITNNMRHFENIGEVRLINWKEIQ
jgi:predicted nucleic acid-binding protein